MNQSLEKLRAFLDSPEGKESIKRKSKRILIWDGCTT